MSEHEAIESALTPYLGAVRLTEKQLTQVQQHLALLVQWNARVNLTSVRDEAMMLTRHFGESFFAAVQLLSDGVQKSAIDLGSGAGFPGLPLAVYAPQTKVTLIESHSKKATFLKEAVRAMELTNVTVFLGRAESSGLAAELVTMRAVEKFEAAAKTAAGLVAIGGRLAMLIGERQVSAAKTLLSDLQWNDAKRIPGSEKRVLLVGTK